MLDLLNKIPESVFNPQFTGNVHVIYLIIQILFIAVSLFFLVSIIYTFFKTTWFRRYALWDFQEFITYRPYGVKKLSRQWLKTKARLNTGMESEYKLAVVEADSVLDETLSKMGFGGQSLGERLEKLSAVSLPNINEVKETHKARNNMIHDPNYRLNLDDAKKAIDVYEKALIDLQAL